MYFEVLKNYSDSDFLLFEVFNKRNKLAAAISNLERRSRTWPPGEALYYFKIFQKLAIIINM